MFSVFLLCYDYVVKTCTTKLKTRCSFHLQIALSIFFSVHHFLLATARSAKRVLAIVWAFVCPSVCPSVTLRYCVKTMQAKITRSSPWAAPRTLVYRDKISCPWLKGFPSN